MSLARRKALVALSQQYDVPIVEDDCYVDLRFEGRDEPSIHSLDGSGRVLYVASFSKIIAPGMRIGYMTGPREFLERALGAKSGGAVNTFGSWAVHRFSTSHLHSHIEEINDIQKLRRDAILAALDENFSGSGARWSRPEGGLFIWLQLPEGAGCGSRARQHFGRVRCGLSCGGRRLRRTVFPGSTVCGCALATTRRRRSRKGLGGWRPRFAPKG